MAKLQFWYYESPDDNGVDLDLIYEEATEKTNEALGQNLPPPLAHGIAVDLKGGKVIRYTLSSNDMVHDLLPFDKNRINLGKYDADNIIVLNLPRSWPRQYEIGERYKYDDANGWFGDEMSLEQARRLQKIVDGYNSDGENEKVKIEMPEIRGYEPARPAAKAKAAGRKTPRRDLN